MRLLHIIATLNQASGGPAAAVGSLLEFSPAGVQHEVVTLDDPAAPFLTQFPFHVPVHALGPTRTEYGFRLLRSLTRNRSRFDGVLVNGLRQFCGFAVWRALRGHTPDMIFPHGMLDPYFRRAFPLKHLKKWIYWLAAEYWILRAADRVLFTTERQAALARFTPTRWLGRVVPYGATAVGTLQILMYWMRLHPEDSSFIGINAQRLFSTHFDMRPNATDSVKLFQLADPAPVPIAALERA